MSTTTQPSDSRPTRDGAQPAGPAESDRRAPQFGRRLAAVTLAGSAVVVLAAMLPDWPSGADMGSTHYMGLLAANQPWNLLLFMGIPVVLAETIAVTELVVLFGQGGYPRIGVVNRYAGLAAGFYFLGVFSYLMVHAVTPITTSGGWRGPADLVAVGFYLLGVVPLYGIALLETRVLGSLSDERGRRKLHAIFVGAFLVVAHIAMIFGMLDPTVLGWQHGHLMPSGVLMPGTM